MTDWRQTFNRRFIRAALLFALQTLLLMLLFVSVPISAPSKAEDGTVMRYPIVGRTRFPSGLFMEVDTRWVEAQGYRPVRIQLGTTPSIPSPADRTIRVEIKTFSRGYSEEAGDITTAYITLPEGKKSVSTSIPVRQEALWTRIEVECFEGGVQLLDMSSSFGASSSARRANQWYGWDQDALTFLVIHSQVPTRDKRLAGTSGATRPNINRPAAGSPTPVNQIPDLRALALQVPDPVASYNAYRANNGQILVDPTDDPKTKLTDAELIDWLATRSNFEMLPPEEVPSNWLELTGFDFITLSIEELEALAKSSPKSWEAIQIWAHGGGNLIVYGLGADPKRLADLDKIVEKIDASKEWKSLAPSTKTKDLEFVTESVNGYAYSGQPGQPDAAKPAVNKENPTTSFFTTSARPMGLGMVIAIQENDIFPGESRQWNAFINSIPHWRSLWSVRNGVSLSDSNVNSYWNFAIPGFGMAPVMLFVGLISIFVVLLGPVNYAWLKRRGQLSLLIFTVPLGAFITIFSLSAYALLGDGVSTRVRAWSVTELDQRTGRGTSLSHQTYYAGIPPWGGLSFPKNAAVYPVDLLPERMGSSNDFELRRSIRATHWEDKQDLSRGFISSRTLSQVVVICPFESERKLLINGDKVTNQLGVNLKHLFLRDSSDRILYCAKLAPGETTTLRKMDKGDEQAMEDLIAEAKPQPMKDFDAAAAASAISGLSRYRYSIRSYSTQPDGDGMLLEEFKQLADPVRTKASIGPQTYLAISDQAIEMPLGSKSAAEIMSLHVIRGKW
jgi:hypothetical protein